MTGTFRVYLPEECGRDGYPLAWHKIDGGPGVKHLVREAAGHRCERCGHPYVTGDGEWSACDEYCKHGDPIRRLVDASAGVVLIEARWRILTVHHLLLGADGKRDLRWWNLVALCQRDHLQIQSKVQMERPWITEHSDWFKPYAAGFYAWKYEGVELTREETMERLDELLDYERVLR